ncbi:uncharacterized protein LOC131625496 [Vicia villosa]|uniref:uncharacterized protein LOC131625496 n=1 Tax=Vicia villosa TaxID=3911 RepID=UPI00273CBCD3|nr:uncharacterized protein LOC131625496 [Vicia villosa]
MPKLLQICYLKHQIGCQTKDIPLRRKYLNSISGPPSFDSQNSPTQEKILYFFNQQTEENIIWMPYKDVKVRPPYDSQIGIAKSITHVIEGSNHIPHRPHLVPKQLFEGDIDPNSIGSLVHLINTSSTLSEFKSNWETRRNRLVLEASEESEASEASMEVRWNLNSSTAPSNNERPTRVIEEEGTNQNSSTTPSNNERPTRVIEEEGTNQNSSTPTSKWERQNRLDSDEAIMEEEGPNLETRLLIYQERVEAGASSYQPTTPSGKYLIAHRLRRRVNPSFGGFIKGEIK